MDDKNNREPKKGFGYWWNNVFLFHYKNYALVIGAIIILVVLLTIDAVNKVKYDFGFCIAAGYGIDETALEPLIELVKESVGDVDGNGEINVEYFNINLNTPGAIDQLGRLELSVTDDAFILLLLDDARSSMFGERGDLDNLEYFGFDVDPEFPYRMYIGDNEVFADFPPPEDETGGTYRFTEVEYAVLTTWKLHNKGALADAKSDAAVRVLSALAGVEIPAEATN